MSIAQPIIRFPLFLMAVIGGIQTLRYHNGKEFTDPNLNQNLFHTIFPWGCWKADPGNIQKLNDTETPRNIKYESPRTIWRKRVDFNAFLFYIILCVLIIIRKLFDVYYFENVTVKWLFHSAMENGLFNYWLQFLLVHSQFTVIIGLCMDEGKSMTSRFLRSKVLQFLGRISLSLYLTHWPIMGYVSLAINGQKACENDTNVQELLIESWNSCAALPLWSPILTMIIAPIIAFLVTKYFEEPLSNVLKK